MNSVQLSGWINSDVFDNEKVSTFFLRFGVKKTVKVIAFKSEIWYIDAARGDYVIVKGRLDVSEYKGVETHVIIAESIEPASAPERKQGKSYSKSGYQKQPYQAKKSYDI